MKFEKGARVQIHTKYGGRYDGKIGTVRHITTTDLKKEDGTWFRWSPSCDGWYEVWFDPPYSLGAVTHDVFLPEELKLYEEGTDNG